MVKDTAETDTVTTLQPVVFDNVALEEMLPRDCFVPIGAVLPIGGGNGLRIN